MSVVIKLGKETLIYGIGQAVTSLIGIITVPLLTGLLSKGQMGQFDVILTIQGLLTTVLLLGTDTAITFYYWDSKDDFQAQKRYISSGFFFVLSMGMMGAMTLLLLLRVIGTPDDFPSLVIVFGIFQIPNQIVYQMFTKLFRIFKKPVLFISVTICVSLFNVFFLSLMLYVLRLDLLSAILSQFVVFLAANAFCLVYFRKYLFGRPQLKALVPLIAYGSPLVLFSVLDQLVAAVQRPVLIANLDMDALGVFSVSGKIAAAVGIGTKAFTLAWGPFSMSIKNEADAPKVYGRVAKFYLWIGLFLVLTIQCLSPVLVNLLSSKAYSSAVPVVPVLSLALIFQAMYGVHAVGLNVVKKTGLISFGAILSLALSTGFTLLLTPSIGIFGAAGAMVGAYLTTNVGIVFLGGKYYPIPYEKKPLLVMAVSFASLAAIGMVTQCRSQVFAPGLMLNPLLFLLAFLATEWEEVRTFVWRLRNG